MTTDITELAQRMKAAAEKATPGEWWADEVKNEGCYGSGDDCVEGFTSYAIYGSDGQTLFDSLNSDAACICEEYDGEGHVAWDETAQRNAEFIALANPANVLALVEALEKAQRANAAQDDHINQQQDRIDQLEKGHQEAAKQINSWRRMAKQNIAEREKDIAELDAARQRIAELESRTVKLPDDEDGQAYGFGKWSNSKLPATAGTMTIAYCEDAWRAAFEVLSSAVGIKVEADSLDADGSNRNQPGMVVAVHIDVGDFVKFRGQVYEVKETDFDDHDVTLWFVCGEVLKCAAGCPIEVVSAPVENE
ncbi:ead/Ea22-like family protein [Klebsiella pneumoniae]|uniref:ead/Ea22-like family protein n=2 Tax=Klebsiella pneumoniae TaxID=573 RepID=UPI00350EDCFA